MDMCTRSYLDNNMHISEQHQSLDYKSHNNPVAGHKKHAQVNQVNSLQLTSYSSAMDAYPTQQHTVDGASQQVPAMLQQQQRQQQQQQQQQQQISQQLPWRA